MFQKSFSYLLRQARNTSLVKDYGLHENEFDSRETVKINLLENSNTTRDTFLKVGDVSLLSI